MSQRVIPALIVLVCSLAAHAQENIFTWEGDINNNWDAPGNWENENVFAFPNSPSHTILVPNFPLQDPVIIDLEGKTRSVLHIDLGDAADPVFFESRVGGTGKIRLHGDILYDVHPVGSSGTQHKFDVDVEVVNNSEWRAREQHHLQFNGELSGSGNVLVRVSNAGDFGMEAARLTSANSYDGTMTIARGYVYLTDDNALQNANVVINRGNGLRFAPNLNPNIGSLSGTHVITIGAGTLTSKTSKNTSFSGALAGEDTAGFVKAGSGTLTHSGNISGIGLVRTEDDGGLILDGGTATCFELVASEGLLDVVNGATVGLRSSGVARAGSGGTLRVSNPGTVLENGSELALPLGVNSGNANIFNDALVRNFDWVTVGRQGTGNLTVQTGARIETTHLGVGGKDDTINGGVGTIDLFLQGSSIEVAESTKLWTNGSSINVFGDALFTTGTLENPDGTTPTIGLTKPLSGVALTLGTDAAVAPTTFSGTIADATPGSAGDLLKVGSNHAILAGNNSFSGGIELRKGQLTLAHSSAAGSGTITVPDNLEEKILGYDSAVISNPIDLNANLTVNIDAGNATQSGAISETGGSFGLEKTGAGKLMLTGTNSFSGNVLHSEGILGLGGTQALGSGSLSIDGGSGLELIAGANVDTTILVSNDIEIATPGGNTLFSGDLNGLGGQHTVDKSGPGSLAITGGWTIDRLRVTDGSFDMIGGSLSIIPDLFNAFHVTGGAQVQLQDGAQVTVGGGTAGTPRIALFGDGTLMRIEGGGTRVESVYLDVAPSGSGHSQVEIGSSAQVLLSTRLSLGNINAAEGGIATARINSGATVTTRRTDLHLNGHLIIDGASLVTGILTQSTDIPEPLQISDPTGGGPALTVGSDNLSSRFTADILDSPSGPGSIRKIGNGSFELPDANSFSGGVVIDAGSLIVNNESGSATGSGPVQVNSGGTLGGEGIIEGPLTITAGGTIAPGNSTGVLNTTTVDLDGTYLCELGGSRTDHLVVSGSLDLSGAIDFDLTGPLTQEAYIIATYGSLTGRFSAIIDLPPGYRLDYAFDDGHSTNHIALVTATAYESWALARGLDIDSNAGLGADPNGDGKPNLLHFAFDTDPLGDGGNNNKKSLGVTNVAGLDYLTWTVPVRNGATFSGTPLTSSAIDGVIYEILGDDDLNGTDLSAIEIIPPLDNGLPALGDYDGINGPDYQYRTFRLNVPVSDLSSQFIWSGISTAP